MKNEAVKQRPEGEIVKVVLDKPIGVGREDQLGFQDVATSLLEAIESQPNESSLTLGLDGVWGSGKSSILAPMLGVVKERAEKEGLGTAVVTFSPWLIRD